MMQKYDRQTWCDVYNNFFIMTNTRARISLSRSFSTQLDHFIRSISLSLDIGYCFALLFFSRTFDQTDRRIENIDENPTIVRIVNQFPKSVVRAFFFSYTTTTTKTQMFTLSRKIVDLVLSYVLFFFNISSLLFFSHQQYYSTAFCSPISRCVLCPMHFIFQPGYFLLLRLLLLR